MNRVSLLTRQVTTMHGRLSELYRSAISSSSPSPELLPAALKELGVASEELHVVMDELIRQNEQLLIAKKETEAERQRYQSLFDFAPDCYLITDAAGIIQEANRAAATLLNIQQQFLIGKPLINLVLLEHRSLFRSQLNQLDHRDLIKFDLPLQKRNSEYCNATLIVDVIRDSNRGILGLRWLVRDVTEQKRAEAALEQSDYNPSSDRSIQTYYKGDLIPLEPQTIWLVTRGVVKLTTLLDSGEEMLVGLAAESMVFGSGLTSLPIYQAIALTDAQFAPISVTEIDQSPRLAQVLLPLINQRLRQTEAFLAVYGQIRVEERLNRLLQLLKQEIGQPISNGVRLRVRLTHQDFASACCTTRVTITRLLNKLQQQGELSLDAQKHLVLMN